MADLWVVSSGLRMRTVGRDCTVTVSPVPGKTTGVSRVMTPSSQLPVCGRRPRRAAAVRFELPVRLHLDASSQRV